MGQTASVLRGWYQSLLPESVRTSPLATRIKIWLMGHDAIYNHAYYSAVVEGPAAQSAGAIADSICGELRSTRVVDVGCGTGALLAVLRDRGCEVFGLEYASAALESCRARNLTVKKFDLEHDDFPVSHTFDAAVSLEVAEHLPAHVADRYVALLTRLSRIVVFSAARPGQGGTDHVNEQQPEYWIAKFAHHGFRHADEISQRWRDTWRADVRVANWYHENLMIFRAD